jgi:hypothetical protein
MNKTTATRWIAAVFCCAGFGASAFGQTAAPERSKPRVVITTDPELDDSNSLVRFLLYSTDVRVEGLVYASSQFHWKGDGKGTKWSVPGREYTRFGLKLCPCTSWRWAPGERYIDDAVETYEKVYPNLKVHNPSYPTPAELKSKIRVGNIEFDGDISKDTAGSDLIKSLILDDKGGPLFLAAWGGHSTIARALKSIQDQYENTPDWPAVKAKISAKVVLLPSGDQDDTYAKYIKPNWPEIDYRMHGGGPRYGYGAQRGASAEDAPYFSSAWMKENVSSRGPLGAFYRVWGDGKQMVKDDIFDYFGISGMTDEELKAKGYVVWMPVQEKGSWLGEGDTGTFMNLLNNGLRAYEDGSYGGWGGRKRAGAGVGNFNAALAALEAGRGNAGGAPPAGGPGRGRGAAASGPPEPDFLPAVQRDFAARLKWSVTPRFADANHEPTVKIKGPLSVAARPGETIRLAGDVSDPDSDPVTVKWWQYRVGSYPGEVAVANPLSATTDFRVPADAAPGQTIHLILEATDHGTPALTRYQRVIVTVQGK